MKYLLLAYGKQAEFEKLSKAEVAKLGERCMAFDAELAGPWPRTWTPDPGIHTAPHRIASERHGCQVRSTEAVPAGTRPGPTDPGLWIAPPV